MSGPPDAARDLAYDALAEGMTAEREYTITAAVSEQFLAAFGDHFTDAYPLMFILAVGILAKAATGPADTILNMLGHQRASAMSIGLAAVISVTLNLILIPLFSVTGAAIARVVESAP